MALKAILTSAGVDTGLKLDTVLGTISGIPTVSGNVNLRLTASNSQGADIQDVVLSLGVAAVGNAPRLITTTLPPVRAYDSFSFPLEADGALPMTWEVVGGNLDNPPFQWNGGGLPFRASLDRYMGYVRSVGGTPNPGNYTFNVKITNAFGSTTGTVTLDVSDVGTGIPVIKTTILPAVRSASYLAVPGQGNYNYSGQDNGLTRVIARGATPMTWSITAGALPAGMSLNANTGEINGRPNAGIAAGAFNFTVRVSNAAGAATQPLTINVEDVTNIVGNASNGKPVIVNRKIPDMTVNGSAIAHGIMYSAGGNTPITWSISGGTNTAGVWSGGGLPAGITLDGASGIFSGQVATSVTPGEYFFTVVGTNSAGTDRVQMSTTISPDPTKVTPLPVKIMGPMIATYQGPGT